MSKTPISQKGHRYNFDILVIGSGIAGLSYLLNLCSIYPHCKIALITKKALFDSNSYYAQGGIAAVSLPDDSIAKHTNDTLKAGDGLSNIEATQKIIEYGPLAIQFLIENKVQFDTDTLAREGGHSRRRIYHSGDCTGKAVIEALITQVKTLKQVTVFEHHTAINLIVETPIHQPGRHSEVIGAYVLEEKRNKIHTFIAHATILATGGAGKVYRYTSNIDTATGDGLSMAYRAGARLGNLEFYQFHPTLLYNQEYNNFLISEALRGENAHLIHPESYERFMKHYDPKKMELATRDIVARAIFNEIERCDKNFVYLDIRNKTQPYLKKRFPTIFAKLKQLGINMSKDFIPVVPAAHYLCGGIVTDITGKTDLLRLYAIGEVACTGLHGANRLASNSLLEGLAMAYFAAQKSVAWLKQPVEYYIPVKDWNSKSVIDLRRASQINVHWRGLRGEMTSYAGIIRTEAGLKDLFKLIRTRREMIEDYYWKYNITRDLIELRNIVLVAELIVRSALKRRESRGGHYREDFPKKSSIIEETIFRSGDTDLF